MDLGKFEILEDKITRLVERVSSLKKENNKADDIFIQKDNEIKELHENLEGLNQERELIRTKIDKILTKLENLEEAEETP